MPISQLRTANVPNASLNDNSTPDALAGRSGEAVTTQLHGKYYTQCYRGNVFIGTTAIAGVILPIFSNTAHTFGLWNPAGSGKNLVPIRVTVGFVNTTSAAGNYVYAFTPVNIGSSIGTPVSAFTQIVPINAFLGSGVQPVGRFSNAITLSAAAAPTVILKTSGMNQLVTTTSSTTSVGWTVVEDFDGTIIIPPGLMFLLAGNAAPLSTTDASIMWEEVPQ